MSPLYLPSGIRRHTYLLNVRDYTDFELVGRTRDDAAGEAFDKVARSLGLPYPGGPHIDRLAKEGDKDSISFPRVYLEDDSYDFSFSGLKTAVLNYLNQEKQKGQEISIENVAASFQQAVLDILVDKSFKLANETGSKKIVLAGGVAANQGLREIMEARGTKEGIQIYYPSRIICTDNAAMIGSAAYYNYRKGLISGLSLNAEPNLGLN